MNAELIARVLGGRKVGVCWMARCPAHEDRAPSLSVRDAGDKVLVRCHAGCGQEEVIAALRERGLWEGRRIPADWMPRFRVAGRIMERDERPVLNEIALAIWRASVPARRTVVESYLASRELRLPPAAAIRFHRRLKHPSGGFWPAMVALVTRGEDAAPMGVHRTFIAPDGGGKAPVDPARLMLGPCCGGAVRLAEATDVVMVGEGIETCLSALQATGLASWSALSASGLRSLRLPASIREVIVLADADPSGEKAARAAAERWAREGRRVRIARPPRGLDFNDVLLGRTPEAEGGAT